MHCASNTRTPKRQRGYTLLLVLLVLLVGGTSVYLTARDPGTAASAREATERARMLKQARTAVIAYAFSGGASNQPGALPCVDNDVPGDGVANSFHCSSDNTVYHGHLPWKTIDTSREQGQLWYVIDGDFRDDTDAQPVNVALDGSLELNDETGYAALIIDPGDVLVGQDGRPSDDVTDYLEGENADGDDVFIDCANIENCNDRIVGIRVDPLFEVVQRRVLVEVAERLREFYLEDDRFFFPFAAGFDGDLSCEDGLLVGRVATSGGDCEPPGPGSPEDNTLKGDEGNPDDFAGVEWILENDWLEHVVYRVDEECVKGASECVGATLQLGDDSGLSVVLGAAGTELDGQIRTGVAPDITDFLESEENTDGDEDFDSLPLSRTHNDILRGFVSP